MASKTVRSLITGAALVAGSAVALPSIASATTPPASFSAAQQQVEQALTYRVSQLTRLSADVSGSSTLSSAHASLLNARISTESADINALVTKVPSDTTFAELNADRAAMIKDNRVFAVETPQVLQIIEADSVAAQITTMTSSEASLQAAVNSLTGQPSYNNALRHYNSYVAAIGNASSAVADVTTTVLAQVPSDYPTDVHVFVSANHKLLAADIALAHASYDATIIGLASGGYTGS